MWILVFKQHTYDFANKITTQSRLEQLLGLVIIIITECAQGLWYFFTNHLCICLNDSSTLRDHPSTNLFQANWALLSFFVSLEFPAWMCHFYINTISITLICIWAVYSVLTFCTFCNSWKCKCKLMYYFTV